jgi:hypothetical protein
LLLKKISTLIVIWPIFILLLFSECYSAGSPETARKIIVAGTGVLKDDDTAKAREDAISESLVAAVGIVIAEMMPIEMLVQNFEKLNEMMYTRKKRYINGYRVLTETEYNALYRVVVEATISRSRIKKDLSRMGFLIGRKKAPAILLLLAEQEFEDMLPRYWWGEDMPRGETVAEKAIGHSMEKLGFTIVPHKKIPEIKEKELIVSTPEPDNEAVTELGRAMKADFIIIGSAVSERASNTMGEDILSFKGTISARAIRVNTGEEVAAVFKTDVSLDTDELSGRRTAVTMAGESAGNDLGLQITKILESKKASEIKVVIQGEGYLSYFAKFRKSVMDIPQVSSVRIREMKSSEAIIFITCKCSSKTLAKALMFKTFDSFGINISEEDAQQLNITIVSKKSG